jgi:hypothetical protein
MIKDEGYLIDEHNQRALVNIRIEGSGNTGKTALGTVIEDALRTAGANVERAPLAEHEARVDVEESREIVKHTAARGVKVLLSERHTAVSGMHLSYDKLFQLDHAMPGYVKLWHDGRVVLTIEPMRELPDGGGWKPVYLDELVSEDRDRIKFVLEVFDRWPVGRVVARLPLGEFHTAVLRAKDYLLVWILSTHMDLYSPPLQPERASLLRKRGYELLDQVLAEHISDMSLVNGMYREEVQVLSAKLGKPEEPKTNRIHIVVEGPGNTGKVAMTHLIAEMLSGLGLPTRRTEFDAPAPEVLGMSNERAAEILRELATRDTDRVFIDVSSRDVPRGS